LQNATILGRGEACWVSTQWLAQRLGDPGLRIIDTQPNIHDYIDQHIPGAVYMDEGLLRVAKKGIPGFYVPPESIEPVLGRLGIQAQVPILVYTSKGSFSGYGSGLEQCMVAYSLARFGHRQIYILDGGLEQWIEEGRPTTKKFPAIADSGFKATEREDFFIEYDEFRQNKDRPDALVLDARSRSWYEGQGVWERPGHIPGALNLPWDALTDPANPRLLRPTHAMRQALESVNAFDAKDIYCYCGTGREATILFLVLRMVFDHPGVRVYEGAFTEWCAFAENPTVTGPSPRWSERLQAVSR